MLRLNFLLLLCFGILQSITAQVNVDVNFDLKHRVGSKETFDREKFIVLHAGATENDYNNELGKLDTLMNLYDAYYGRETGRMRFVGDQVSEDPNRMGFADSTSIAAQGTSLNANYAANTAKHPYEKGNLITAAQDVPFYPNGNNPTKQGWFFSSNDTPSEPFGSATGQFMGLFTRDLYGTGGVNGPPRPTYVEVMNEPVWPLVDEGMHGGGTIQDIFNMHLTVADSVKRYNPGIKVGGYTTAFPEFEKFGMQPNGDTLFGQWEERWQKFIDEVGPKMDFYSVHLYDFPSIGGKEILRKGGNIEATFDMIEHYNTLVYGNVKPWVISEYGSQLNDYYAQNWSPFRDWQILKAFSSMMIQFMERPDVIEKTIPFVLTQADFSFGNPVAGFPYPWRMMRRANEPSAYTGDWVFTEVIKFYELWSDVKGTRVDTKSTDPDLMVDAYVDQANNKAYLILNNIDERNFSVNLNEFGLGSTNITNVKIKHLYLGSDDTPRLDISESTTVPATVVINEEACLIIEYTFDAAITLTETSEEEKIYATTYKQKIAANQAIDFTIPNVTLGAQGEAVLRLGLGRDLSANRIPAVSVNGNIITVPTDYRGDIQLEHDNFFGMLEIDVPYSDLVNGNNTISVTFSDAGGFVSSCALQLFDFSKAITRQNNTDRSAMIAWDNEAAFIPQGGNKAEFRVQDEVELTLTYSTAVASGMEKDLDYVAVQLRELDENGMEVATSAFTTSVAGTADNAGTVNYLYTIPSNFATPNTDPIVPSSQLDAGHQYLLIIFSASDGTTTFVNDNTPVTILGAADRPRELTWDNAADFFDKTGTTQELYIGSDIDLELTYQTGISGGVTEDLNYIATQIKQFDENGMEVNASAFTTILDTNVPNSGMTTFTYTVPSTFADGTTAIPTTPNLPAGHTLRLLIFMSVDNDAAFADDNRDIILLDGRTRAVSWENEADYVPGGGTLAQFCPGETFPVTLCYSTGITGGVEEDLNYVAMQVRQVDASFGIVNTSAFQAVINGSAPNQDLTTFDYTLPTTFGDGSPIPATADLPAGHKLLLLIFMSIDSDSGFADDNTEIEILDAADAACTTIDDRARSISWENEADYVPNGGTLAQFCPGETFSTTLAYSTGITNGVEEDLNYVAMYVRQVDAAFNIIKDSDFFTVVNNSDPNQDTITFDYTLPTTFADDSMIPATADLPAGHKLLLLIFMSVDNDSGFANDNTEFELLSSSNAACMAVMDRARTINWENESNYFAAGGDLPFFEEGETFSTTLAYSTGVSGGVEEDLNYVAMQVRQIDAAFNIINTSTFQVVVDGSQPNVDTVTFNYTLPTTFNDGSSIPTSDMLPAGHRLLLLIFMSVDMDAGFVDDNTEIHIYAADCPTFITETMNLETATGYYQVSDFIETNNRILSPLEVVLDATNDITMKVGFEVQAGASFVARIEGCTASSVNQAVEERTEAVQEALSLYPNPTDGLLNISGLSLEADYGVQVFSASGKLIQNVRMRNVGSQLELETSALANGLYFVKIISDQVQTLSFIKQ